MNKHQWVDDGPDSRLPNTWHQKCAKCGLPADDAPEECEAHGPLIKPPFTTMQHARFMAVGLLATVVSGILLLLVLKTWPWFLAIPVLFLIYICGRGLSGGFRDGDDTTKKKDQ